MAPGSAPRNFTLTIGHDELRIRGVHETLSIANDFLAGRVAAGPTTETARDF